MSLFEVDRKGLAKILTRKGKEFIVYELIQNAWDQQVKKVLVTLTAVEGMAKARIVVEDDDPNGFADLSHAYTLFAESRKKSDPTKAGRFNFGEKLAIAACDEATVVTTTGGVRFDREGRHSLRRKTDCGSRFDGTFACTRDELREIESAVLRLIPRAGIETQFNGKVLAARVLLKSFDVALPTEVADPEGNLVRSTRTCRVEVYEQLPNEIGMLYELGIPVVETQDKWHVNVTQKVPLTLDRENVPPSFLRRVRVEVLNQMHGHITKEDANQPWVREGSADPKCSPEAIKAVLDNRFGEKRVAFDPSDPEANSLAVSKGYVVVHGGMLGKQEWANAKDAGAILPAGKVTPSPKPYSQGGELEDVIPNSDWSDGMKRMESYAVILAKELMDVSITVKMTRAGNNFSACYSRGEKLLTFNLTVLGKGWFGGTFGIKHDDLLIHEFGHHYESDHLSERYHDALTKLGAKFVELAMTRPELLRPFKS